MSAPAILIVVVLAAAAFGIGVWLGVRSAVGEKPPTRKGVRCIPTRTH